MLPIGGTLMLTLTFLVLLSTPTSTFLPVNMSACTAPCGTWHVKLLRHNAPACRDKMLVLGKAAARRHGGLPSDWAHQSKHAVPIDGSHSLECLCSRRVRLFDGEVFVRVACRSCEQQRK